ncbi:MAG TPA: hypothetical protein VIG73_09020, partial [Cerasibacillus sp.]
QDLKADDIMSSIEITDNLEGSGYTDSAGAFESIQELTGTIKSGEEITGQFITDIYEADVYYFRENPANVDIGVTNQVVWTIPADEAK